MATAMAVDDSAMASPPTSDARQPQPSSSPTGMSRAAHSPICNAPPSSTARRMAHRRWGSSSSPMTNSISTTPSSDTCRMATGSDTSASPTGPMATPASK